MGVNGSLIGTKRWVKEFGRWVLRVPARDLEWMRKHGMIYDDQGLRPRGTIDGPPGLVRPRMWRTRPRRRA